MLRMAGTATAFTILHRWRRGPTVRARKDLLVLAGLAMLGVVLNQVFFLEGVKRTTAIHTNIIITTIPAFTLAVAMLLRRERGTPAKIGGILLAGAGAAYLALSRGSAGEGASMLGDSFVLINSLFYASYLVLSKDVVKRLDPVTVVTYVFLIGCLLVAPVGIPSLLHVDPARITLQLVLVLLYIILFPTFLSYLMSIWALKRAPSSLVAMYVYVQPVVTAFLSPLILGERVTPRSGVASLLIFAGLALATRGDGPGRSETVETVNIPIFE
jgi:drug/metabolite transporter (DMT)-like permease